MLNLKYKIGSVVEDEYGKLWAVVFYDEETQLYNIQELSVRQVSEFELNSKYKTIDVEE